MKIDLSVLALLPAFAVGSSICPSSAVVMHAGCSVEVLTTADCTTARTEIYARINGQYDAWHDPHNNGTYSVVSDDTASGGVLSLQRLTGDEKYTDKINFAFADSGSGCSLSGCSESQVSSIADFSTNYCNQRMLYCGESDGCHPVDEDLGAVETAVDPNFGSSADPTACLVV